MSEQQELRSAAQRMFDGCQCCQSLACRRLQSFLQEPASAADPAKIECLHEGGRSWMATLLNAERKHAGGKRRVRQRYGRPRSWRRQVGQYLIAEISGHFERSGRESMRARLAGARWAQFARTACRGNRAGIGGKSKLEYINAMSAAARGSHSREAFAQMRRSWARDFDDGTVSQGMCRATHRRSTADRARQRRIFAGAPGDGDVAEERRLAERAAGPWGIASTRFPVGEAALDGFIGQ
eukprot:14725514-Alexandrium_andersonii.AAC.1